MLEAQIPLAVLGEEEEPTFNKRLFSDWVFWLAVGLPFLLRLLEGLHFHFPSVPYLRLGTFGTVPILFNIKDAALRSLFDTTFVEIHLALIGIAILMRADVSAGFWGFELGMLFVGWLMLLVGIGQGEQAYTAHWTFGYSMLIRFSRLGASFAAVAYMLWAARERLSMAWRLTWHPGDAESSEDSALGWSLWGIVGGCAIYLSWALASGMGFDTAMVMLIVQIAIIIILARVIADGGIFWCSASLDPMINTSLITGTEHMTPRTVSMMVMSNQMPMAPRGNILPNMMDGLKLASVLKISPGRMMSFMFAGVGLASIFSLAAVLYIAYTHGAQYLNPQTFNFTAAWPWETAERYILHRSGPNTAVLLTMIGGAAAMLRFIWLHRKFQWWPLYPFAFALAESATMEMLWLSLLIGWVIRVVVLRMGAQPDTVE